MKYQELVKKAEALYAHDSCTPEKLAKETGVPPAIFQYIRKGLVDYVDSQHKGDPKNVARRIEQESSGEVDYQTMLSVIVNFAKKAFAVYEQCQASTNGSRRSFAAANDMDWTYFENFYWRYGLGERRGNITRLPKLKEEIESLEKLIA